MRRRSILDRVFYLTAAISILAAPALRAMTATGGAQAGGRFFPAFNSPSEAWIGASAALTSAVGSSFKTGFEMAPMAHYMEANGVTAQDVVGYQALQTAAAAPSPDAAVVRRYEELRGRMEAANGQAREVIGAGFEKMIKATKSPDRVGREEFAGLAEEMTFALRNYARSYNVPQTTVQEARSNRSELFRSFIERYGLGVARLLDAGWEKRMADGPHDLELHDLLTDLTWKEPPMKLGPPEAGRQASGRDPLASAVPRPAGAAASARLDARELSRALRSDEFAQRMRGRHGELAEAPILFARYLAHKLERRGGGLVPAGAHLEMIMALADLERGWEEGAGGGAPGRDVPARYRALVGQHEGVYYVLRQYLSELMEFGAGGDFFQAYVQVTRDAP